MNVSQRSTALTSIIILGTMMFASPGLAQDKNDIKQAKQFFIKGRKALDANNPKDAIKLFTKAFTLSKRAAILYYVAQAYEADGQLLVARKNYQRYLDEVPDAKNAEDVLDTILKLQQRIRKEYARLIVKTAQDGRLVFLKGEKKSRCTTKSKTSCIITLTPGKYTVIIKAGRGTPSPDQQKTFDLNAGDKTEFAIKLKAEDNAKLMVNSDVNDAKLKVGTRTVSLPMDRPLKLKEGQYPITITKPDGFVWKGQVDVKQDEVSQLYVPLEHTGKKEGGSLIKTISYALVGTGAGLLVGGFWMGSQTNATFESLERQKQAGSIDQGLVTQGRDQQFAANTLMVTGTLAVISGAGLFAWDFFSQDSKTAKPSEPETPPETQPKTKPKKTTEPDPDKDLL